MTSGDGHSSLPASGITSAAPIVAFATAQCNALPLSRASPNLCPMMRQTMAEAWDQSLSDGSRGHAIVASESPEVGTVRKIGKSRCASRKAVATSAAISSNDCRMISRRDFLRVAALCCPPWMWRYLSVANGAGSQGMWLQRQIAARLVARSSDATFTRCRRSVAAFDGASSREDYYGCDDDCGRRSQAPCRAL